MRKTTTPAVVLEAQTLAEHIKLTDFRGLSKDVIVERVESLRSSAKRFCGAVATGFAGREEIQELLAGAVDSAETRALVARWTRI